MKTLNVKRLTAENFLCFGPEGIDLQLNTMGNVVVVMGKNFDDEKSPGRPGSNGTGKSSIQEILVYGLFGKPVKRKLSQKDVIHTKVSKNCKVSVEWDIYRVERGLKVSGEKPSTLRLWESAEGIWDDSTEITAGSGNPETQRLIEARLGVNYRTFVNVVCFDDRNATSFLECDGPTKREIVENLLSLDKYREFGKSAKELLKECEKNVKALAKEYAELLVVLDHTKARTAKLRSQQDAWKLRKKTEAQAAASAAAEKREQSKKTDSGALMARWQDAQERISALDAEITLLMSEQSSMDSKIALVKEKLAEAEAGQREARITSAMLSEQCEKKEAAYKELEKERDKLNNLTPGVLCGECQSVVNTEHYERLKSQNAMRLEEAERILDSALQSSTSHQLSVIDPAYARVIKVTNLIKDMMGKNEEIVRKLTSKRSEVQQLMRIPKPEQSAEQRVADEQIAHLKALAMQLFQESAGVSPYDDNIRDAISEEADKEGEVRVKKDEVAEAEKMIPYYKYWVNAFGDDGIRKFVIEGIVPALNSRISHWLNCLIYGNISLTFDSALEETINRVPFDAEEFVYYAMSGGEQRRINLAVTLSFAHVMMLNSGRSPNLIFLDEVAINIDENGIEGVYNMILQLAQDKKVFVTTHDPALLSLLQGTTTLQLERKNGFTKRV